MTAVLIKTLPTSVQEALRGIGYWYRDINVVPAEKVSPSSVSGQGSRSFFTVLSLDGSVTPSTSFGSWGGSNPFEAKQADLDTTEYHIPLGGAVIKGNKGDKVFASLYVNPLNVAPLLPIKPAYRKEWYERSIGTTPSQEEFLALQAKGLIKINKAGSVSITTDGKNACEGERP